MASTLRLFKGDDQNKNDQNHQNSAAGTEENEPVKEEVAPFDDVKESDWYYGELLQAKKEGLSISWEYVFL